MSVSIASPASQNNKSALVFTPAAVLSAATNDAADTTGEAGLSWRCVQCNKPKDLQRDHLKGKTEVRSDCWPCAKKTTFKVHTRKPGEGIGLGQGRNKFRHGESDSRHNARAAPSAESGKTENNGPFAELSATAGAPSAYNNVPAAGESRERVRHKAGERRDGCTCRGHHELPAAQFEAACMKSIQ
jgi:hypothetical protein